ncbi:DUF742 domain-containing protein [Amycolatopsis viridis]|uniref:DUF742 domain-containing protein n=1 Tax=Amycolatopsis viridis TaxID=185678 RepID=A0ABX0SLZ0_9PSEU|nr:DUF742 domain-containing protein [Amycolatopsis viridis]NIH77982.1 hypothetical protein [Amycolatopsis viridis]
MPDKTEDPGTAEPEDLWERPYTITAGRTRASVPLDMMSLVSATGTVAPDRLQLEHAQALRLCGNPISVTEVAAVLKQPIAVTKILLADLVVAGAATAHTPRLVDSSKIDLLKRLADGLKKL